MVAPVALFYNVANGFHNAPNFILNDDTVRRRDNITGFRSGVKVAAKVRPLRASKALIKLTLIGLCVEPL